MAKAFAALRELENLRKNQITIKQDLAQIRKEKSKCNFQEGLTRARIAIAQRKDYN